MNQSTSCLQANDIESLFDGDVTPDESGRLESHLAECSTCRERIERTIGSERWWSDVQQSLQSPDPMSAFAEWSSNDMAFANESGTTCVHSDDAPRHPTQHLLDLLGPSDDPQMLGRIGGYEITGLLGQGGMGVVFKGFDRSLNRFVAIKMLLPHLATSGAARKRFAREAQAVAAVVDDHVMPVHFVGEWQGIPYLVMTYSKGVTLQSRLNDSGPLELKEILRIGLQAARGLAAAHAQGLVHRDVKPANIFLSENVERVQLMDFGLARAADDASLTRTGILAGTPQYMSPEQARAEQVDHRSDLFSLGSVIYSMCTGRPPFRADSSHSVLRLITDKEPRPIREINSDVPKWLCRIVDRLMAKQAAGRYESAEQVADVVEDCLAHVQCPDTDALPESVQPNRKKSKLIVTIATACFAMAAFLGFAMFASPEHDVAGKWQGEPWGIVELHQVRARVLEGTYSNAFGDEQGDIRLKWSRIERRYKGTWGKGADRFGKISLRRVGEKIRGAWTTKDSADIAADVPELGDFAWTRAATADQMRAGKGTSDSNYYGSQSSTRSPKTTILTSPYWKRNFRSDHGVTIAQAKDGRIAIATAVEQQTDPNAGVEGIVVRHVVELLEANSMGETLRVEIDPAIPFGQTSALTFSPNGKYLALGTQNGLVSVFDAASGKVHLSLASPAANSFTSNKETRNEDGNSKRVGRVTAMAFSPDGKLLAFCGDRLRPNARRSRRSSDGDAVVQVWDVERGILQYEFDGLSVATDLTFSPSGKFLACAGNWANNDEDGTGVVVLNGTDGRRVVRKATTANGGTRFVAYSPNGRFLTCEHHFDNETRTTIRLWDNRTLGQHSVSEYASHANFSKDGSFVAALCRSKSVRFLDADRLRQIHEVDLDDNVNWYDLVFSEHENRFVVAGMDKSGGARVELWRYQAVDRQDADASAMHRSMFWGDGLGRNERSELMKSVKGVLTLLRGGVNRVPPLLWQTPVEQRVIRILNCEGHEALAAEQLLANDQKALLVTKPIKDDGGTDIVAEALFEKRDDNSWDPVDLEVKPADQIERDVADFLKELPDAKPVSMWHDNLLGRLQGRWQLTRQVQPEGDQDQPIPNGSFFFVKGDRLMPDGSSTSLRIEIDESQSPPYFDTYVGTGVSVGRCVLEGDIWKVCAGEGQGIETEFAQRLSLPRPDKVEPNPKWMYLEFKRVTDSADADGSADGGPNGRKDREPHGTRNDASKNGPPFASPRAALAAYLTALKQRDREAFAATILGDPISRYATALFNSQHAVMRLHDAVVRQFGSTGWTELADREHALIDALCLEDVETFLINIKDNSATVEGSSTNVILKNRRVNGWKVDVEQSLRTRAKRVGMTPGNLVNVMNDLSMVCTVFSGQVSAYRDAEALDVAMGKALAKVLRTSAVKPHVTIDLNGLYWDAADARFRVHGKKQPTEQDTLRQPKRSESAKTAERVSLVDTKAGICQIGPCIKERKLKKIAEPIEAVERAKSSTNLTFLGKGGQTTVRPGMRRMFALPKPTRDFVYREGAGKSPPADSESTIKLRKYADHVHVDWPKGESCTFTYYATPTAKFHSLDDFAKRSVYRVVAQTTGYGKPPEPGQFCDLGVSIHDVDPTDPEVRSVLTRAPVLGNTDPQPDSTRSRDVIIELLLTDEQIRRVELYEDRNAFSFRPLP